MAAEPHPTPATRFVDSIIRKYGREKGAVELERILSQIPATDLAGLFCDWEGFWARPEQIVPQTDWITYGRLAGRGNGKTTAIGHYINAEVRAGRAMCIGLAAQNETKTIAVQVQCLKDTAHPRFVPDFVQSECKLYWPNGAYACVFTPESPDNIRSENMHLSWLSEVQSWSSAPRSGGKTLGEEALMNFDFATRVGYARQIWDATPKRGNALLKLFLARSRAEPANHIVVGGTMYENRRNLSAKAIAKLDSMYAGTRQGREELLGEMLDDCENALVRNEWINKNRRPAPDHVTRRILSADPAKTSRTGSDRTGLVDLALASDGQLLVMGDYTGRYRQAEWIDLAIDKYIGGRCDLLVIETNTIQDALFEFIAMVAKQRGLVAVLVKGETTRHQPGVIYVKEVFARGPKEDRAQPVATAYERGRVSHVIGADLVALEESLTTWEPAKGMRSPDSIDALAHGAVELLGASGLADRASQAFVGIAEANASIVAPVRGPSRSVATMIGGGNGGGRI
jgi:phage terminase large subunit-like protein